MELPIIIKSSAAMATLDLWVHLQSECDEVMTNLEKLCLDKSGEFTAEKIAESIRAESFFQALEALGKSLLSRVDALTASGNGALFDEIKASDAINDCREFLKRRELVDRSIKIPEDRLNIILAGKLSKFLIMHKLVRKRAEDYCRFIETGVHGNIPVKFTCAGAKMAYIASEDVCKNIADVALPLIHTHLNELLKCLSKDHHAAVLEEAEHCTVSALSPSMDNMTAEFEELYGNHLN